MKKGIVLMGCFICWASAHAQYNSRLGRFQVDQVRGCAPFTVTILDANLITTGECTTAKPCQMAYLGTNLTSAPQNLFSFTYDTPGNYSLLVNYQSIGVDDITITVDPNVPPDVEVYSCSGTQVSVKVTNSLYFEYEIDFGDGTKVIIPTSNNQVGQHTYLAPGTYSISVRGRNKDGAWNCTPRVISYSTAATPSAQITELKAVNPSTLELSYSLVPNFQYRLEIAVNSTNFQTAKFLYSNTNAVTTTTFNNLQVDDFYYCFRIIPINPCTSAPFSMGTSNQVCSQNFDLTIQNGVNKLDWQTSLIGISDIGIIRNSSLYQNLPTNPPVFTFPDRLIECKVNYCYQLVSRYSGGATSTSLEKCGVSFKRTPPTIIDNTSSMVDGSSVQLNWLQDPLFVPVNYTIFKSSNNGTFFFAGNSTSQKFTDSEYSTEANLCYKINYTDKCDNQSLDSSPICPIRLTYSLSPSNEVTLNWSGYVGWSSGVQFYRVEKYNRAGSLINTFNAGSNLTWLDNQPDDQNQIVSYKIVAISNQSGLTNSISNQVEIHKPVNLFFPTAFTPDNKGPKENETFFVGGQFISKLELSIFDRWGSLIFYTDKKEVWDGTQSGQPMPIATYVWTATITDISGQTLKRSGTVVLLRK